LLCVQHWYQKFLNKMYRIACWVNVGSCSKPWKY
jgi:hypothetical protein